jgi:hypothetical protein
MTLPYTFSAGQLIDAVQINANFAAVPAAGSRAHCSNSAVNTFLTAVGVSTGAYYVPVFYNGSAWIVG